MSFAGDGHSGLLLFSAVLKCADVQTMGDSPWSTYHTPSFMKWVWDEHKELLTSWCLFGVDINFTTLHNPAVKAQSVMYIAFNVLKAVANRFATLCRCEFYWETSTLEEFVRFLQSDCVHGNS